MKFSLGIKDRKALAAIVISVAVFVVICAVIVALILKSDSGETPSETDTTAPDETLDENINGVWVASVYNIDFPSKPDLTRDELCREIDSIVDTAKSAALNAVFFQVRPSADALYKSEIFPVSKFLSSDGVLTLDCLEYIIEKAHSEGISVHAWINPLRANLTSSVDSLPDTSPVKLHPEYCVTYADSMMYFDCGLPEVRELVADGVREIIENYDVDGIVFDDYFYPYPKNVTNTNGESVLAVFADDTAYKKYGEGTDIADFRRDNVNKLIETVYNTVKKADKNCVFGVSPFGIWKNGMGDNTGSKTAGLESYSAIYCDTLAWIENGTVDYVAPQLYWTSENTAASYDELCSWWGKMTEGTNTKLLISHGAYRYSDDWENPSGIMAYQIDKAANEKSYCGSVFYGYSAIKDNVENIRDEIRNSLEKSVD